MNLPDDKAKFVDNPSLSETFVDSIHHVFFDGHTLSVELCVTRIDEFKPPNPPTAKRYPVCRLVLTPQAMVQLSNNLQQFMSALEQQGLIKKEPQIKTPVTKQ